jgi:tetratricopeptide (TPR) repeat protein
MARTRAPARSMAARRRRGCGRCCLCPREDAGVAAALNNLGTIAGLRGDYERATAWHEAALALRRELGDTWGVAHSLTNLGDVASDQGVYERAATLYEEGLTLRQELQDRWGIASSLHGLAQVAHAKRDHERADALAAESLVLRRELGDTWGIAHSVPPGPRGPRPGRPGARMGAVRRELAAVPARRRSRGRGGVPGGPRPRPQ